MLKTIRDAVKMLDISESKLRRAAHAEQVPVMWLGNRMLVDVDAARELLTKPEGVTIDKVSAETGLTITAIRRAVREGWLPYTKPGKAFLFQMDEVQTAIERRMSEQARQKRR